VLGISRPPNPVEGQRIKTFSNAFVICDSLFVFSSIENIVLKHRSAFFKGPFKVFKIRNKLQSNGWNNEQWVTSSQTGSSS